MARKSSTRSGTPSAPTGATPTVPVLLSGGNPQIAKGYGDAPVQAYIAAMPGWKSEVGKKVDALVQKAVPDVQKAVKWNSPLYGMGDQRWFLGVHCFAKYIKLAFFQGDMLTPMPPETSRQPHVRYFHIREGDEINETQLADWVVQASKLPGEKM